MQVEVYHQQNPFDIAQQLRQDDSFVLVDADKLTKVATIDTRVHNEIEAAEIALVLTEHDAFLWHENQGIICHQQSRSTGSGDLIYIRQTNS